MIFRRLRDPVRAAGACAALLLLASGPPAGAQSLTIDDDIQTYGTLSNVTVTVTGTSELRLTGTDPALNNSMVHLNSPGAWLFFHNVKPSVVNTSAYRSQIRIGGAALSLSSNARIVQHGADGTVVIPQGPGFEPLTVHTGPHFTGASRTFAQHVVQAGAALGAFDDAISSLRLRRGYAATVAQNAGGGGISRHYVAQDEDIEIPVLPAGLDDSISFIRVFPWRWTAKKGIAGDIESGLNVQWGYNWNIDRNSTLDWEYVPIRQTRWWPGLDQDWRARGSSHLLGYNEPDRPDQANMSVEQAISGWPDLLATGLRLGAPAVSDGGLGWLYSFIDQADAAGLRVDFVPVHYYRCRAPADAAGAASQFHDFLRGVHERTGRPLWVTEWNNGANWTNCGDPTPAQQKAAVEAMIDMLERTPFVERYALFNWVEEVRALKAADGSLTPAGVSYRDKASGIGYQQVIPEVPVAPAAHYRFEGSARDSSAYGHAAMLRGAARYGAGRNGRGVVLSGSAATADHVLLSPRLGDSTDFTFAAWVHWNGGGNWQRIFDLGTGTSSYLYLTPRSGSGQLQFAITTPTFSGEQRLTAAALPVNVWTHVAVTISGNTGKLFVNGALVATNTGLTLNPVEVGTSVGYLGRSQFSADPYFSGMLDEVVFLPSALPDARIGALMTNSPPAFAAGVIDGGTAVQGRPYSGSLAGRASDPDAGDSLTYGKVHGPAWLTVAPSGALGGTPGPAEEGTQQWVLAATDSAGASAPAVFTVTLPLTNGPGTWAVDADGLWSDTTKWAGAFPANGPGHAASFDALDITADRTVTLDRSRTVGGLSFGDTSGGQSWTVAGAGGSTLTLQHASTATVTVVQNSATLALPVVSPNGLRKTGRGTLILAGDNALGGSLKIDSNSASANDGALRISSPEALTGVTDIGIRNNNSGHSVLELDGGARPILSAAPLAVAGRSSISAPAAVLRNVAGANVLSGDITLNAGGSSYTLLSDAGVLDLTGNITPAVSGVRTLAFGGAGDFIINGELRDGADGALALTKFGAGTLILQDKDNTFSGPLTVSAGVVQAISSAPFDFGNAPAKGPLGNPQAAGRGITVGSGASLVLAAGNVFGSRSSTTAPAVSVTLSGGTLRLAPPAGPGSTAGGDANIIGAFTLEGGTLLTGNGHSPAWQSVILMGPVSSSGTSSIGSAAGQTAAHGLMLGRSGGPPVAFSVAGTLQVSAPLVDQAGGGAASLVKSGSGVLRLHGNHGFTGPTVLNAGTLVINGSFLSPVTVAAGAVLAGNGLARDLTLHPGAILSPGDFGPGSLSALNVSLGGTLAIEVPDGSQADRLAVVGSVSLSGPLTVAAPAILPPGTTYVILSKASTGPVSGQFAGRPEGAAFLSGGQLWLITYVGGDGNDVALSTATASQAWRHAHFGSPHPAAASGHSADADGDGEPNLLEFATGQSPVSGSRLPLRVEKRDAAVEVTYVRSAAALQEGVAFSLEQSPDLTPGSWSPAGAVIEVVGEEGALQTVRATLPVAGEAARYLRLRVTAP